MDKLAKVRAEVARIQLYTQSEVLKQVLDYIDEVQKEPVSERFAFKAIPRLLEMIEPTDRAKAYIAKLADTLEVEGYSTDAKIVRACLKIMNGEKVPMATMNEEPVSEDLEDFALQYAGHHAPYDSCMQEVKDAVKAGSNWKEQQMIANAIDAEILENYDGKVIKYDDTILDEKLSNCKVFDKVKVILIKGEEI